MKELIDRVKEALKEKSSTEILVEITTDQDGDIRLHLIYNSSSYLVGRDYCNFLRAKGFDAYEGNAHNVYVYGR